MQIQIYVHSKVLIPFLYTYVSQIDKRIPGYISIFNVTFGRLEKLHNYYSEACLHTYKVNMKK